MADDLFHAIESCKLTIESCKQNMTRSFDKFQRGMDNNFQRLLDTTRQHFSELDKSILACQRKQEERMNRTSQKLNDIRLVLDEEEEQDSLPVILDEKISQVISTSPTKTETIQPRVLEQINSTSEPLIHVEYDFVLPSSTTKIKSGYNFVLHETYTEQHSTKSFSTTEFTTAVFATTGFAIYDQRTSTFLVFDPGGISYLYVDQGYHCYEDQRRGRRFYKAKAM